MTYRLRRDESPEIALRRIALEQIDAMLARADGDDAPERIAHSIRKRCKKLRGLLRLVRGSFAGYRDEQHAVRDVARRLAPIREPAARIETLDRLRARDDGLAAEDASTLRAWLDAPQAGALDTLAHGEALAEVRTLLHAQRARVPGWTLDATGFDAVRRGLVRTHRRGRGALREAIAAPVPHRLHELRKRVKYHRFHLELLRGAWHGPFVATADAARAVGDVLGEHHDAAVLIETLRARIEDTDIGAAAAHAVPLLEAHMRELERRALPHAARLFAEKPRAFERRMHAYWRAWRPRGTV